MLETVICSRCTQMQIYIKKMDVEKNDVRIFHRNVFFKIIIPIIAEA